MYICVDFDGTIADHDYPDIGKPVPYAIDRLLRFQELGGELILFTMRSGESLDEAVDYVEEEGIKLFGINRNPTQDRWTLSPKAYGHLYIDDAAFGCPLRKYKGFNQVCVDWSIVGPAVEKMLKEKIW